MKILIATHGELASGLIKTLEMFSINNDAILTIELTNDGIDDFEKNLKSLFKIDDEWLCLCDLKGGTPFKSCLMYKITNTNKKINIITGVNFPMLLEASIWMENRSLEELTEMIIKTATNSIELIDTKE